MKRNALLTSAFVALAALTTAACSNQSADEGSSPALTANSSGLKIGYIEIDTLMSQYDFCKDYTIVMNKKGENIRATLAQKERALQNKAAELQNKYETNQFTTKEQVEQAQLTLQRQQQDLQELSDRLTSEFASEQNKYNEEMRDSIQSFLKDYNKKKQFDYILSKAGDNILVANPLYDITDDVVKGLNKRYKRSDEVSEMIKAEE